MGAPPHSFRMLRYRPRSQMEAPLHDLHLLRSRPCSQMEDPPHGLHLLRRRPCSQMEDPSHALHVLRRRPCSQMEDPSELFPRCRPRWPAALPLPSMHRGQDNTDAEGKTGAEDDAVDASVSSSSSESFADIACLPIDRTERCFSQNP